MESHFDERAFHQLFFPVPRKWQEHQQAPCYFVVSNQKIVDTYGMDEDLSGYVGLPWSQARTAFGSRAIPIRLEQLQEIFNSISNGVGMEQTAWARWEAWRDRLGRKSLDIRSSHFIPKGLMLRTSRTGPFSIGFRFKEFPDQATLLILRDRKIHSCLDVNLVHRQHRDWTKVLSELAGFPTWCIEMSWSKWQELSAAKRPWRQVFEAWKKDELSILPRKKRMGLILWWWSWKA